MLLYQGSEFVRGNKFKDSKGNVLTFEKNTKDGKLFSTADGHKVALTESQVAKLKLTDEKTRKAIKEVKKINEGELLNYDALGMKDYMVFYDSYANLGREEDTKTIYTDDLDGTINKLEKEHNSGTITVYQKTKGYRFKNASDYEQDRKDVKEAEETKWKIEIIVNGELTYYNRLTNNDIQEILSVANSIEPNIQYESEGK